ncbi:hypothetical protein [Anaerosalibacter sp. Marseille-P3206]|uniref:hypothetical protein n=1 Tax=Anaerosalibacter sp. Marseille-P3206 TaxID=1871005 RepID=UPI0009855EBD|nr:hypothetical protein [Anaerosalibacter sp. Marseille-P3206]
MKKYLFLDRGIIDGHWTSNAILKLNQITKDVENNPMFREDYFSNPSRPWEVRYDNGYPNVFYDKEYEIFRCYYTLFTYDIESQNTALEERTNKQYIPTSSRITSVCYAESKDGVNWVKPNLGLVEFDGNKDNNILMRYGHGTSVLYDEDEVDPNKRYKLMTKIEYSHDNHFMAVAFSSDGIHFSDYIEWPKYNPQADTYNFVFRDKKTNKFIMITRVWKNGVRIVAKCESNDFINWSEPEEILRGNGFEDQIYSMPVFQYAGIYLGLASVYHEGDRTLPDFDLVDLKLKFATDLNNWDSICPGECFIPRGEGIYPDGEFDCGCIYASIPVEIDDKLYFYYMGGNGQHTNFRETSFGRGFIEKDKFAYYTQRDDELEGELHTGLFSIYGNDLSILADIEEDGYILIELEDKYGNAVQGFTFEDCIPLRKADGFKKISFKDKNLLEIGNKSVKFKFKFQNSKLYALKGDIDSCRRKY